MSRRRELPGLVDNGTFQVLREPDVPADTRIFGARFVDELNPVNLRVLFKIRLVAQN